MDRITGEIRHFTVQTAPEGWLPCNGQVLDAKDYQMLFDAIGNTYGGNGSTRFAVPDMNNRTGQEFATYICHLSS